MYTVHVLSNPSDGIKFRKCKKKNGIPCPIEIGTQLMINNFLICHHNHLNCIEKTAFDAMLFNQSILNLVQVIG